jgi:hypothetical protein
MEYANRIRGNPPPSASHGTLHRLVHSDAARDLRRLGATAVSASSRLLALSHISGTRGRHTRRTSFARFAERVELLVRHESRWVFGGVVAGGAVLSVLIGMTIGGAFTGVDVALAPNAPATSTPKIVYATPGSSGSSHAGHQASRASSSHPATGASGNHADNSGNAGAGTSPTTTSTPAPDTSSTTPSPTTTPTTPTTTTTPPTPSTTTPSGGSGGKKPSGPLSGVQKIIG